jgi:hypothetical protein
MSTVYRVHIVGHCPHLKNDSPGSADVSAYPATFSRTYEYRRKSLNRVADALKKYRKDGEALGIDTLAGDIRINMSEDNGNVNA